MIHIKFSELHKKSANVSVRGAFDIGGHKTCDE